MADFGPYLTGRFRAIEGIKPAFAGRGVRCAKGQVSLTLKASQGLSLACPLFHLRSCGRLSLCGSLKSLENFSTAHRRTEQSGNIATAARRDCMGIYATLQSRSHSPAWRRRL
jgi:hypothetical protein